MPWQGCIGKGVGGTEASQILSWCYYVYKQLLQKDVQNLEMLDMQTSKLSV